MSTKKNIGVVPAAGFANRISPLPCSKEIYPVGYEYYENGKTKNPKVISSYLFEHFKNAGSKKVYMIIRKGKWDIPQYFGTGSNFGLNIAYLVTDPTPGTPHTVNKAFPFIKKNRILFGFPDIQIVHKNPFKKLLLKHDKGKADLVLGLFKTDKPHKFDMVEFNKDGLVSNIVIKPDISNLEFTWLLAVWDPVFTDFLRQSVSKHSTAKNLKKQKELYIGNVIQQAIKDGLKVSSVSFPNSEFIDIGTADDLKKSIRLNICDSLQK